MKRFLRGLLAVALVVGLPWAGWRAFNALRPLPKATAGDADRGEAAFMDSDLGSEAYGFMPQVVFQALPKLFPEKFPEGWAGYGLIEREGKPPIGLVPSRMLGLATYSTNCALCHVGRVMGQIVPGAPANDFNVSEFTGLVVSALTSSRLTVDALAKVATEQGSPLSLTEKAALAGWLAEAGRRARAAPATNAELGPGRSNALNGWKRSLGLDFSQHVSHVDLPPIFNQRLKERTLYDGSITGDGAARITLTELQKGRPVRDPLLHRDVFDDLVAYLTHKLRPPKYPWPVDAEKAARGRFTFEQGCADCHGTYSQQPTFPNRVVPLARVGTDPERALAMSEDVKAALTKLDYRDFLQVEVTGGYLAPALDGVWATAPYLHNGAVPTLWHLLSRERPVTFWRRFNAFDPQRVGLACDEQRGEGGISCPVDAAQATHRPEVLWLMDTRKVGNSSAGHDFGVELDDAVKGELLEYLKTL